MYLFVLLCPVWKKLRHLDRYTSIYRVGLKMTQDVKCDCTVTPIYVWNFTQSRSWTFSTIYWNNSLLFEMAQNQSRSSISAIQPTLIMLMFDDLKQMLQKLQQVPTVVVVRTLTACNHTAGRCCRSCLINRVLEMSAFVHLYAGC